MKGPWSVVLVQSQHTELLCGSIAGFATLSPETLWMKSDIPSGQAHCPFPDMVTPEMVGVLVEGGTRALNETALGCSLPSQYVVGRLNHPEFFTPQLARLTPPNGGHITWDTP